MLLWTWYLSIVEILIMRGLSYPEDGFGLQQAVLEEVSAGSRAPTARLEALILVERTAELRGILEPFYKALGLTFRPESVADLPGTGVSQAIKALADTVEERYAAREVRPGEETLQRARSLRENWRAPPGLSGPVSSSL